MIEERADLILRGGKIATLDAENRSYTALAAHNGRIVALIRDIQVELTIVHGAVRYQR